jgi:mannose-6-phosphate isomerase-like protein (cupin superfamily)
VENLAEAEQQATGESVELAYVDRGYMGEKVSAEAHGIRLEVVKYPDAMPTAAHVRSGQEETYAVRESALEVLVGHPWSTVEVGQSATVPAGTPYVFRNRSGVTVRFLNEHRPALRFEEYFRTVRSLAEDAKIEGASMPGAYPTPAC